MIVFPSAKKAPELKWTAKSLDALFVKRRTDFTDPQTKGLSLRVTPKGTKTWTLLYRRKTDGEKRRIGIGSFPEVGLAEAREEAARGPPSNCRDQVWHAVAHRDAL